MGSVGYVDPRAVYDCDLAEAPCGECIVCLGALLDERTRDLEVAQAKAEAWDRLVEMRGELGFHVDMQAWLSHVVVGRDDAGLQEYLYGRATEDPIVAVTDVHARWRELGKPVVAPASEDERSCRRRHLEDHTIESAEEIKARRAAEGT